MSTVTAVAALEPLSSGVLAYIAILVVSYLLFLLGVSIWSWNQNRGRTVSVDEHFTAGSSLGPIVLSFTLFATSYSGYTVIGIPNEAYVKGFMSNRWSCMSLCVVTISVVIYSRLREVSMERKYNSPASLIQDRYQSKVLHRAVALIMAIPMQFYVTAQFTAIGSTIVSLSQGNVPALAGQIVLAIIMLLYETFGGLKGVAITDVLQGCLLLVGTIGTCFVLATVYGPFDEAWDRIINTSHTQWKMLPTVAQKVDFFSFMAAQMAFPIYPHVLQRVVAARSTNVLKISMAAMSSVRYFAQVPGIFLGLYGRDPNFLPVTVASRGFYGFALTELLHGSTGTIFTGGLMLLGSLTAIMSTADSAIIACSNVVTIDLIKGWLWPLCNGGVEPNGRQTLLVSKFASLIIVIIGVVLTNTNWNLSSLFVLQGAMLCQALPAFILGLYHPTIMDNALLCGMFVGTPVFFTLQFSGPELKAAVLIAPGIYGLFSNIIVTFIAQFILQAMGKEATPDVDKLTNTEICRIMENNKHEPAKNPVLWVAFGLVWLLPPWYYGEGVAPLLLGVPAWFVYQMLLHGLITVLVVYVIWRWNPAPPNKKAKLLEEEAAIKTSAVELAM